MWSLPFVLGWIFLGLAAFVKAMMSLVPDLPSAARFLFRFLVVLVVCCIVLAIVPAPPREIVPTWGKPAYLFGLGLWILSGIARIIIWVRRQ
jgi:hypothetical protein